MADPFSKDELKCPIVQERHGKLVRQLAEAIQSFRHDGYIPNYLPFFKGADEAIITLIQEYLGTNDPVLTEGVDFNIGNINTIFSNYSYALCMRFHAILLSVKNSLPCIAIEYDYKSEQLMEEAGLKMFGCRFGIRKGEFFGEEIDMQDAELLRLKENIISERDYFIMKAKAFAEKKRAQVLEDYDRIFKIIGN